MAPFLFFTSKKDPFAGLLYPSTHALSIYPILLGSAHLEKSASGIPTLFSGESMTYGNIVTTSVTTFY